MSDWRTINFDDLRFLFLESRPPREAISILRAYGDNPDVRYLNDMLRWHGDFAISNAAEIRKRRSFDHLLNAYAILEVASLAGYIPNDLPPGFRGEALAHLRHPSVRRYYEQYYPVYLARLFRRRLQGDLRIRADTDDGTAASVFAEFVSMTTAYESEQTVRRFEWFLDGGTRRGYGLEDLLEVLTQPDRLAAVLLRPADEETPLHEATQGFYRFLQFSATLSNILDRARAMPLLRAGMWFYYEYWFDIIGERVADYMKKALAAFVAWPCRDIELIEVHQFVDSATSSIDQLVQRSIGGPLREAERARGTQPFS